KRYFSQDADFSQRLEAARRHQNYSIQPGDLSLETAHKLYGRTLRGSVTQLEKYAGCPFSYFLRYGLKAKERKILKVEAPDVGSLMHKIIELASARIVRDGVRFGALTEAYIAQIADEIVDALFTDMFIRNMYGENRLQALIKRLKGQTAKMLKIISTHVARGSFEPCAFEVAFAENGELKPITVPLPTGDSVVLTGRIDRIDSLRQNASIYIKIIDYKTGSKSFRLSDVYNGLSLQLAVYLIAATDTDGAFGKEKSMPAGMFYFRLSEKTVSATHENTEEALLKQFKMSGLVLKDADIIRAMDGGISGFSSILPARINQNGSISERDGSYATMEQFNRLKKHVYNTVSAIGQEILQGKVSVTPCMNKDGLPCRYCEYHPVCSFNTERDSYRIAPPLKDEAIWEALYKEDA
ncbi:MAG: PD-(D/E)XK nuclease family protein, partial [Clostridia bacterium]|nr:PD-(D/E)XK nuclease family protein [Clostridia bacterium]